jgi:hypothetical protein
VASLRASTAAYLLLPLGLFAYGWLRPAIALPALLLITVFLFAAAREVWPAARTAWRLLRDRPRTALNTLACVAPAALLLTAWLLLSGAGGLGYQNDDYQASNALFKTLILGDWPLTFELDGQPVRLVYYLGYYLPAAAVGKVLGWRAANAALWLWTAAGLGLVFTWFVQLSGAARPLRAGRLLLLAAFFCLFGGLDFIAQSVLKGAPPAATAHLEFWAGYFQYSSNTTLLYWVPQQALAAWLMLSLVVDAVYHPHDLRYLSLSLAGGLLWSPLGLIGLVPYLALLAGAYAARGRWRQLLRPGPLFAQAAALCLAVIVGLYLTANRFSFPHGWIWQFADQAAELPRLLFWFWWVEFGALAVLLLVCLWLGVRHLPGRWRDRLQQRFDLDPPVQAAFAVSLLTLTLLPLYRLGFNNDLVMRASIPSLFVLWLMTSKVLVEACRRGAAPAPFPLAQRLAFLLLIAVVVVGFLPGLAEVARSLQNYRFGPPPLAEVVAIADADRRHLVEQRVGDDEAFFFRYLAP